MRGAARDNQGMSPETASLRIALAQFNPTVGAIEANAAACIDWIGRARDADVALVVLPELAVTGYPPEDLLLKPHFIEASERAVAEIAAGVEGIVALLGAPYRGPGLHNGVHVLAGGEVAARYAKVLLPNYGVFDERRYFEPGEGAALIEVDGVRVGLTICEDIWFPGPPASSAALAGATLIVNASASPYHRGKGATREQMVAQRADENEVAIALCNVVGGQDELVFDGHSVIVRRRRFDRRPGRPVHRGVADRRPRAAALEAECRAFSRQAPRHPGQRCAAPGRRGAAGDRAAARRRRGGLRGARARSR